MILQTFPPLRRRCRHPLLSPCPPAPRWRYPLPDPQCPPAQFEDRGWECSAGGRRSARCQPSCVVCMASSEGRELDGQMGAMQGAGGALPPTCVVRGFFKVCEGPLPTCDRWGAMHGEGGARCPPTCVVRGFFSSCSSSGLMPRPCGVMTSEEEPLPRPPAPARCHSGSRREGLRRPPVSSARRD